MCCNADCFFLIWGNSALHDLTFDDGDFFSLLSQDVEDPNPLIRALSIRTMGYIQVEKIVDCLVEPLRHCLRDQDPYVRKTAAICVAKLYLHDRALVENERFIDQLRDMLGDQNPTVSVEF